ncbi:MAG: cobalamin B12-binding domain-containing protein [Bacteroidetes bacterium]|nr:cobalamin B12-binding domain-containing protein [Bacteroidota bacterium]
MNELLGKLYKAVELGKADKKSPYPPQLKGEDGAYEITTKALESEISPKDILELALIPAMDTVGKKFSENKIYVPHMLMSARAMGAAMLQLKPFFASGEIKTKGTFIIGTVKGDLHDIGKNLIAMTVEGCGWSVVDLGVDVPSERYIEAAKSNPGAVVALSALLTTTMVNMGEIVANIKAVLPDTFIFIGGAPVNDDFCKKIGADAFSSDPQGVVERLNKIAS